MLHYFDRMSMAHSVEARVPFLDHTVVELAATIPDQLKIDRRLVRKAVLRKAATGLIPAEVLAKPKTGFFSTAVSGWVHAQATSSAGAASEWLLRPKLASAEFLDTRAVQELVARVRRGDHTNTRALLAILMLEVWLADTLPRAMSTASMVANTT
jgi:asparagine synthase (glutamine-hydrolysing)